MAHGARFVSKIDVVSKTAVVSKMTDFDRAVEWHRSAEASGSMSAPSYQHVAAILVELEWCRESVRKSEGIVADYDQIIGAYSERGRIIDELTKRNVLLAREVDRMAKAIARLTAIIGQRKSA